MPRRHLTDLKLRNARRTAASAGKVRRFADGGGLHLETRPSGECFWRYRFKIAGNESMATLGPYPDVGLADARERLQRARELVAKGINPNQAAKVERAQTVERHAQTFKSVAEEWMAVGNAEGFRQRRGGMQRPWSKDYGRQVARILETYAFADLGGLPISAITMPMVNRIAKAVAAGTHKAQRNNGKPAGRAASVATLLVQHCNALMRHAVKEEYIIANPLRDLPSQYGRDEPKEKQPLSAEEVAAYLAKLYEAPGMFRATKIYLTLLLLLWCRPGELRRAEWGEFDLGGGWWRVPAEKMKMRVKHEWPLAPEAVKLLTELKSITGGSRWLFPNNRRPDDCMTPTTANRALERLGYQGRLSAHGFRATASTRLHEAEVPSEFIEQQLAHRERFSVKGRYGKQEFLPQRTRMMKAWAEWCQRLACREQPDLRAIYAGIKPSAKVVMLKGVA